MPRLDAHTTAHHSAPAKKQLYFHRGTAQHSTTQHSKSYQHGRSYDFIRKGQGTQTFGTLQWLPWWWRWLCFEACVPSWCQTNMLMARAPTDLNRSETSSAARLLFWSSALTTTSAPVRMPVGVFSNLPSLPRASAGVPHRPLSTPVNWSGQPSSACVILLSTSEHGLMKGARDTSSMYLTPYKT